MIRVASPRCLPSSVLLNFDAITHHPQVQLLKTNLPSIFELPHPLAMCSRVGDVNNHSHQVISIEDTIVAPVAFDFLRFITGRADVIHDLQDGLGKPCSWHIPPVIELEGTAAPRIAAICCS